MEHSVEQGASRHEESGSRTHVLYQAFPPGEIAVIMVPQAHNCMTTKLTATEGNILERLLDGASLQKIAEYRSTSPRTIANQCSSIYKKLRVASRYECLARIAALQYEKERIHYKARKKRGSVSIWEAGALMAEYYHNPQPGVTIWSPRPEGIAAPDIWKGFLMGMWRLRDHRTTKDHWIFVAQQRRKVCRITTREKDILRHVLRGHSNKYIAFELHLTESSVATYLRRAMNKLGIPSRSLLIKTIPVWILEDM